MLTRKRRKTQIDLQFCSALLRQLLLPFLTSYDFHATWPRLCRKTRDTRRYEKQSDFSAFLPVVRAAHVSSIFGSLTPSGIVLIGTFREIAKSLEQRSLQQLVSVTLLVQIEHDMRPCTKCHPWIPHDEHIDLRWPLSVREVHLKTAGANVNSHSVKLDIAKSVQKMTIDYWRYSCLALFDSTKNNLSHLKDFTVRVSPCCAADWCMYGPSVLRKYPSLRVVEL